MYASALAVALCIPIALTLPEQEGAQPRGSDEEAAPLLPDAAGGTVQ
jgi:hypothetical protein